MNEIYFLHEVTGDGLKREMEITKSIIYVSLSILFFKVWTAAIFLICEKLFMESHPACIAGSTQHIGNPISEASAYIGIYRHRYQF